MPTALKSIDTVADLIHQLGDIPPERILWNPVPGAATEEDALRLIESGDRLVELIDGVLVEKAMGQRESFLAAWIITCINNFVIPRKLGLVGGPDAVMRILPSKLRLPDVSFFPWSTMTGEEAHARVGTVAPALACEVLSESNTRREIELKMKDFFEAGTKLFWIVNPKDETIRVHTSMKRFKLLTTADSLDGGRVLPGFALSIADLFAYLDPPE